MNSDTLILESDADLPARAKALNDQGFHLQVLPLLSQLKAHPDISGVVEAARAMGHLGASRAGEALLMRTWRANRNSPAAMIGVMRGLCYRRGPYAAWRILQKMVWPADAPAHLSAEFASLEAYLWSCLRDFESAQAAHERAVALAPDDPWVWVEWSYVCEKRDDTGAAMAAVERALALLPGYRPATQMRARLMAMAGEGDAAMALLASEFARVESAALGAPLFELQYDRGLHDEAWATLERVTMLEPLADKFALAWGASRRADIALRQGRLDVAREQAEKGGGPFYGPIAERIAKGDVAPRVVMLPVGLVRQNWMTCAPATLTSIARFWGRAAEHLEIAEEICYDGTPHHAERRWAELQGFVTREFTADWDSSRALLDAGIPFTLTTTYTASAHLQAVIGYDVLRNSLLIRDPSLPTHTEYEATSLFEASRSTGPRGMAFVPADRAADLAAIKLPDCAVWDEYHVLMAALARHDREAAQVAADRLDTQHGAHRLTLSARHTLALYDGDENAALEVVEAQLEMFPDDSNLQLSKAATLWSIGGRNAHVEWLAQLANRPRPEALVLTRYADRLAEDGRRLDDALRITRRALRIAPVEGIAWSQLAALTWQSGDLRGALPCYRIAACLRDTREDYAAAYFRASRYVREIESGLGLLRERVARFGDKSSAPAHTLFEQLEALERVDEGFAVLDEALTKRPDDPVLQLFYAEMNLRYGKLDEAQALLDKSAAKSRRADWLRVQGMIVEARGDLAAALGHAREASALDPLNLRQHRIVASLLSRLEGRDAAVAWLRQACERFPRNFGLQKLLYEWIDASDIVACNAQLRSMEGTHPGDVWMLRELAATMTRQQRFDEAWRYANAALERASEQSYTHTTLAFVALRQTGYDAAVPHLKQAVVLDVDNDYAINTLINESPNLVRRREALDFVWSELLRQVTVGDGLLTFQSAARSVMPDDELIDTLRFALKERPDLWHAWVAVAVQLCDMGRSEEALALTEEAIQRFPMLPALFLHQARACILQGDRERARASLERALAISPGWARAVRMYVDTVADEGTGFERGERVVRRALLRQTDNADLHALLGWLLERQKSDAEAIEEVLLSLKQDADQSWVWDMARRLFDRQGKPDQIDAMIADVVQAQPGDAAVWLIAARQTKDTDKALQATIRALELEPKRVNAWQMRLDILYRAGRYDEIDALLQSLPWRENVPVRLGAFGPRVLAARGDREKAREAIRGLLDVEPNDYELWRELADWYDADNLRQEYLAASRELVRVAPGYAYAYGFLGHALLKNGQEEEALSQFRRALGFDPAYLFAATNLVDLAIKFSDFEVAEWGLATIAPHYQRGDLAARKSQLCCLKRDREGALAALSDVLRLSGEESAPVQRAIDAMAKVGWSESLVPTIIAAIQAGQCAQRGARYWVDEIANIYGANRLYKKTRHALQQDPSHVLKGALLNWSAENHDIRIARKLIRKHGGVLKDDDKCWGLTGRAFLANKNWKGTIGWQSDWRIRPVTPSWALDNLANAYFQAGRRDEGFAVIHKASAIDPEDADIRLWLAAEAALQCDRNLLAQRLQTIDESRLMAYMRPTLRVLKSYLAALESGKSVDAVDGFLAQEPARKASRALRFLMRDLALVLLRDQTRWWAKPLRAFQLTCFGPWILCAFLGRGRMS